VSGVSLRSALALLVAFFLSQQSAKAAIDAQAVLEPRLVGAGEFALLTLEANGPGLSNVRFTGAFALDNLEIVGGPSPAEVIRIVNGSLSRTFRLTWQLRALAPGPARVREISLALPGQTVRLSDQEIQVRREPTSGGASAGSGTYGGGPLPDPSEMLDPFFSPPFVPEAQPQAPPVFLSAEVQPSRPLVGEQAIYTLYLYTRRDVSSVSPNALPTFRGFWVRDLPLPEPLRSEVAEKGGVRYTRVPILRRALFALRAGTHPLEAANVDVGIENYAPSFFSPPIGHSEELHLTTPEFTVEVQPLPPAPPGFGATVGRLALAATIRPAALQVGETATVTIRLSGAGNLESASPPQLEAPAQLEVLPPEQRISATVAGNVVEGDRTWTYALVPRAAGHFVVHVAPVPYFDPTTRTYRLAMAPPLECAALPKATAKATDRPLPAAPPAAGAPVAVAAWRSLFGWRGLLGSSLAAGCLLVVVVALARRRNGAGSSRPADAAARALEQQLDEARTASQPRQSAVLVEGGWRGFVGGDALPAAVAGRDRWQQVARRRGWDDRTATELGRIAERITYLRQAPQLSATEELRRELIARSRQLLRSLRR
jgi:hypothetical protein